MKMKTYEIEVRETYSVIYEIKARSLDEALEKADEIAADDNTLTNPEHFDGRTCEEVG